jgi:polyisoprenoid-binding protein YceI
MKSKGLLGLIVAVLAIIVVLLLVGRNASRNNGDDTQIVQQEVVLVDGAYVLNQSASVFGWAATKVGGAHTGTIMATDGALTVVDGKVSAGSVTADMKTITVTDITEADMNKKLVDHLASADFFEVEKFPTATISVAGWEQKDTGYVLSADVTIKGVTMRMDIPVIVSTVDNTVTLDGSVTVDQKDFTIVADTLADAAIKDEFDLTFKAVFTA